MDDPTVSMTGGIPANPAGPLTSWGPFRLFEKVGQGAFGEVYRAWDATLQREVALKLLREIRAGDDAYEAVLKEARAMARVRHPNIVTVYGIDHHEGRVGFWSDFVHGRTLSDLVRVQGPFGAREATLIGIEVCRAASAVHGAGLVHGDIKTGNVMREDGGRILLMDFGLTHGTAEHHFGGTPQYMAPELLSGSPATVSSDLYAVGVLLFNLVTGKHPIEVRQVTELVNAHQTGSLRRVVDERPDLPESFARVIGTALEAEPRKRFSSAGEMMAALAETLGTGLPIAPKRRRARVLLIAAAAFAGAVALSFLPQVRAMLPVVRPAIFRVAHADYLKAQDLLDTYYKPGHVESATALFRKSIGNDPKFALAYAGLARAYWRHYIDTRNSSFVPMAKEACGKALELGEDLSSVHVTLGMIYTDGGRSDLATEELEQALRLDQHNSEAYAALADLYVKQGRDADVAAALEKAIDLSPSDWRWPNQLGLYYRSLGKLAEAESKLKQAAALSPDNSRPLNNLAIVYMDLGRFGEARATLEKSIGILPDYSNYSNLGTVLLEQGEYSQAASMYERSIDLNPASYVAYANLASALLWGPGGKDKARPVFQKAIELDENYRKSRPTDARVLANLGSYYASLGNAAKSIPLVKQGLALEPESPQILFRAGESYEILHQRDQALYWIGKAVEHGFPLAYISRSPELAQLRSDPRFFSIANRKK